MSCTLVPPPPELDCLFCSLSPSPAESKLKENRYMGEEWKNKWTNGQTNEWMDKLMDKWTSGLNNGQMDETINK